jgi:uncharacterized delta-60 repeat protein
VAALVVCAALVACNAILAIDGDVVDPLAAGSEGGNDGSSGSDGPSGEASIGDFSLAPPSLNLLQGTSVKLDVTAKQRPGAPTAVTLEDLPRGVTVVPSSILFSETGTKSFEVVADSFAALGPKTARLVLDVPGRPSINVPIQISGPIDTTFGDGGVASLGFELPSNVITPLDLNAAERNAVGLSVAPDGRVLVAFTERLGMLSPRGRASIVRLSMDGTLDTTFGDAGRVGFADDTRGCDLAVLADGTPVVVGSTYRTGNPAIYGATLAAPDAGVELEQGNYQHEALFSVVALPAADAVGVVVGKSAASADTVYLVRISLPLAFAPLKEVGPTATSLEPYSVVRDTDTTVLLVGESAAPAPTGRVLRRFIADGMPDLSWGGGSGSLMTPQAFQNSLRAGAAVDGGFVFAGSASTAPGQPMSRLHLIRADNDGVRDFTFGDAGLAAVRPRGDAELATAHAVVVEPDGHIMVAGYADFASLRHVAIARFTAKGELDRSFGVDGLVLAYLGRPAEVKRLVRQGNDVIAAIVMTSGVTREVLLARIKP